MPKNGDLSKLWRVLVVEDEALIAEELQDRLVRMGCQVAGVADTGAAAIELARETLPDLVLMDIRPKGPMDGIEAAQQIFRRFDTPIVFLTAHSDQVTFQRTQMDGTFGYLLKPFHARDLSVAMAMAVSRFRMDQRVRESEHTYAAIVNSIGDAALVIDTRGRIRTMNRSAETLTGWDSGEAVGRHVEQVLAIAAETSGIRMANPAVQAVSDNSVVPLTGPLVLFNRQGRPIPVEGHAAPILDSTEKPNGAIVILRDITERRLTEEKLRKSHAHLEASQRIAGVGSWEVDLDSSDDPDSRTVRWSDQCYRVFGYQPLQAVLPRSRFWLRVHPDDGESVRNGFRLAVDSGAIFEMEHRIVLDDGRERIIHESAEPVRDSVTGKTLRYIGTARDVTAQRQAEQALREARGFLETVIETSPSMIFVLDAAGKALLANRATADYYGTTPEKLVGRFMQDHEVLETGKQVVGRELNTAPDGTQHWFHTVKTPLPQPDGSLALLGIATDITDLFRTKEALRESEARLRSVVEGMPVLLLAFNAMTPVAWNLECERVTGYTTEEIVGNPRASELFYPDPVYREQVMATFKRIGGDSRGQQWTLTCKDGSRRTIEWSSVSDRLPVPGWSRWIVGVDVTERLSLEEELREAQKMQALGQLAGGVAHDFNNFLTVINGYGNMLVEGLAGQPELQQKADQIRKAGSAAAAVTDQLLAFSQQRVMAPEIVDLNKIVHDCRDILKQLLGDGSALDLDLASDLHPVMATVTGMQQVLVNLTVNARDAMPGRGRLVIRTANASRPGHAGGYVRITVEDSGSGILPDVLPKIFEPFFTTKPTGEGTGLGLATVYGIVKQRGGWIDVESAPGRGATFHVYLPVAQNPASAAESGDKLTSWRMA